MENKEAASMLLREKMETARGCMEHRAVWMALLYDEMLQAGIPQEQAESITRRAIYRCGQYHGAGLRERLAGSTDCREFAAVFNDRLDEEIFSIESESSADDIHIDFHYCPLVEGWKKLGVPAERIPLLCDMAMEGDRGIMAANGLKLDLKETLAAGCKTCRMYICK